MNKYLLVIDMQNDFIDGALGTKEAEGIVSEVESYIRNFDGTVIFTRDTHKENYLETQEGKNLPVVHCIEGTKGWEVKECIKKALEEKNAIGFDKPTFGSKELAEYLLEENKKEEIEEIVLLGLCTDICVISNVMLVKAFLPEVPLKVVEKCCAGVTVESHKNALEAMKMCQVTIQ